MEPGDIAAGARYVLRLDSKQNDVGVVSERRGCRQANQPGFVLTLYEKPIGADRIDVILTPDQVHAGSGLVETRPNQASDRAGAVYGHLHCRLIASRIRQMERLRCHITCYHVYSV